MGAATGHRCEAVAILLVPGSRSVTLVCDRRHVVDSVPLDQWAGSSAEANLSNRKEL